jgi:hypothetical protein
VPNTGEPPCGCNPDACYVDCSQRHICREQREQIDYWTAPRPPNGRPADQRLIAAIVELCDQFAVCGLEPPAAIMVASGQKKWIEAMLARSPGLLFEDAQAKGLQVWGVPIREMASTPSTPI